MDNLEKSRSIWHSYVIFSLHYVLISSISHNLSVFMIIFVDSDVTSSVDGWRDKTNHKY